jgi:hypothetical protein
MKMPGLFYFMTAGGSTRDPLKSSTNRSFSAPLEFLDLAMRQTEKPEPPWFASAGPGAGERCSCLNSQFADETAGKSRQASCHACNTRVTFHDLLKQNRYNDRLELDWLALW